MRPTIRAEALVEKIVSICDEIEALKAGDKKIAESLKNELDIYVDLLREHAKSANESYYKLLSDLDNKTGWSEASRVAHPIEEPEEYNLNTEDTVIKINEVGAHILLDLKENLKEKCKQTWAIYDAFKRIKGVDYLMTQKYLTKWATYQDLYEEFFGEEVQY